jgi:pimeloyl-ACP methyl ester carboxylesterase
MKKHKKNTSTNTVPKSIIYTAKVLQLLSTNLVVEFAKKIFTTPIKYKIPKREFEMDQNSNQYYLNIPSIDKKVMIYEYGDSPKKVLLVHGWSGRGTQLVKIAEKLLELGYSTISFDAPAHGKSPGKNSIMLEFIESILEIEKKYGQFDFIIGHSLGGMATLNAIKRGFKAQKAVIIGSGDSVNDILNNFVEKLKLKKEISNEMRISFEKKFNEPMESYSAYVAAKDVVIPVLVMHDYDDDDVPYTAAVNIHQHLESGSLLLTKGLGHRKILGDKYVISKIEEFIQ